MVSDYLTDIASKIQAHVDQELVPDEPSTLRLFRIYALLALVKGTDTTIEDVHDAWVLWMTEIDGRHEALLPFSELSNKQREQDRPYLNAIHAVSTAN